MTAQPIATMTDAEAEADLDNTLPLSWTGRYGPATHPQFYRRLDADGRDVTDLPGLHDEADSFRPRPLEITAEGDLYDAESGEFLGMIGDAQEPFRPTDRPGVEWVLSKMADAEAQAVAIQTRKRLLIANLDRQEKRHLGKLEWLHRRFDADLESFARAELAEGKRKTLQLDHGKISLRTSKGTNRITDQALAVEYMRAAGFEAVVKVVETVNVTDLIKARDQVLASYAAAGDSDAVESIGRTVATFLESSGPQERCVITAGILED